MQIDTIYMTVTPSVICFFATLLMFRPKIRFIRPVNHDGDSAMARLERRQRRVDTDSYYFGMIIFILAVIYLVFIEIVALI